MAYTIMCARGCRVRKRPIFAEKQFMMVICSCGDDRARRFREPFRTIPNQPGNQLAVVLHVVAIEREDRVRARGWRDTCREDRESFDALLSFQQPSGDEKLVRDSKLAATSTAVSCCAVGYGDDGGDGDGVSRLR